MKRRGILIKCKSGKGIVYSNETQLENKVKVYLVNDQFEPLKDSEGKQRKVLVSINELRIIGYVD